MNTSQQLDNFSLSPVPLDNKEIQMSGTKFTEQSKNLVHTMFTFEGDIDDGHTSRTTSDPSLKSHSGTCKLLGIDEKLNKRGGSLGGSTILANVLTCFEEVKIFKSSMDKIYTWRV